MVEKKKKVYEQTPEAIRELATATLLEVADDVAATPAARAASARTLLEAIGVIGRNQDLGKMSESRNAAEMTPAELSDEIARLSKKLPPPRMKKLRLT